MSAPFSWPRTAERRTVFITKGTRIREARIVPDTSFRNICKVEYTDGTTEWVNAAQIHGTRHEAQADVQRFLERVRGGQNRGNA